MSEQRQGLAIKIGLSGGILSKGSKSSAFVGQMGTIALYEGALDESQVGM